MKYLIEKANKLGINIPKISSEQINEQIKPVLRKMEKVGIRIDPEVLKKLGKKLSQRLVKLEKDIFKLAGHDFNLGSPSQMAVVLFREMKLSTEGLKKTKSDISTAASELRKIEAKNPIIPLILEHRELSKLISTYLKPLPTLIDKNFRIHTTYGLETSTGRLNSSEPNLQNIPIRGNFGNEIRAAFVAGEGMKLISADYSQIELRVVACLAEDKKMIEAFHSGQDIHARTAAEIFHVDIGKVTSAQRRKAKAVNFGIVYGQTPYGLSQALQIDQKEAGEYITHYFDVHKGIKNYINNMIEMAHDQGYVETLFGTKRYLPEINSTVYYIREAEERMAINMPVQGTAAEILKLAMIELDKKLSQLCHSEAKPKNLRRSFTNVQDDSCSRMLLSVHDEIVIEAPAKEADKVAEVVKEVMENVVKLCVPIEVNVGIGDNWSETK